MLWIIVKWCVIKLVKELIFRVKNNLKKILKYCNTYFWKDGRHRRHKHNTTASEDESEFDSGEEVEHRNHHRSRDHHYPAGYPPYPPMAYMPPYNYYMPPPPPMYQNMMPGQQQVCILNIHNIYYNTIVWIAL